jgi:hypothetical protein
MAFIPRSKISLAIRGSASFAPKVSCSADRAGRGDIPARAEVSNSYAKESGWGRSIWLDIVINIGVKVLLEDSTAISAENGWRAIFELIKQENDFVVLAITKESRFRKE